MPLFEDIDKVRSVFGGDPANRISMQGGVPTVELGVNGPKQGLSARVPTRQEDMSGRASLERIAGGGKASIDSMIAAIALAKLDAKKAELTQTGDQNYRQAMAVQGLQNKGQIDTQGLRNTGALDLEDVSSRNQMVKQGDKARLDRIQQQQTMAGQAFVHGLPAADANTLAFGGRFAGSVPQAQDASRYQALKVQGPALGGETPATTVLSYDQRTGKYTNVPWMSETQQQLDEQLLRKQLGRGKKLTAE